MMTAKPRIFRASERKLIPAVTETGTTMIAREIHAGISRSMGAGIEVIENATVHWTVTYDEVLFMHSGRLILELEGERHECLPGDIIWLPEGTTLTYIAEERAEYFYAVHPVDWAARQGTKEP